VMKFPRRQFLHLAAGAAALPAVSRIARAQAYPSRPVILIVPVPAGSSTDVTLRSLATATERHLGQPIVVENRVGAAGALAPAQMAATARPDGYTIAQIQQVVFRVPFMRKTTYDPSKDFTYIIAVTGFTYGVVVRSDAPWQTFREFLADAKANPGKVNYSNLGSYVLPHITMERIAKQQGIRWTNVPFRGGSDEINALAGGHIHAIANATFWAPQVNAGQFRLLVTFGANRTKSWPTVPTLRETGIDIVAESPYGLAGPKGMDPKVVKILHDAFKKGMEEPSFAATLKTFDQEPFYLNSEDYHKSAMQQIAEQKQLVEELGLKEE
jgi:tripartite-type tricarboxylate transporter receptor subunit TctC